VTLRFPGSDDPARPLVMGIVNVTPDSFADGGRYSTAARAIAHGRLLASQGADLVDVGGESTRPGAPEVLLQEELERVLPVVTALVNEGIAVSIDTRKPEVMRACATTGAVMVNDVEALQAPGALGVCAAAGVAVCLMHMKGTPRTMQAAPHYDDVVAEVRAFLVQRARSAVAAGIQPHRIVLDPGFGFGKTADHNLTLMGSLAELAADGFPIAVGFSQKSTLGVITGRPAGQRMIASVTMAVLAAQSGASLVRVHDVAETVDALKVWRAVTAARR
jgi:dihydropteroate synthase